MFGRLKPSWTYREKSCVCRSIRFMPQDVCWLISSDLTFLILPTKFLSVLICCRLCSEFTTLHISLVCPKGLCSWVWQLHRAKSKQEVAQLSSQVFGYQQGEPTRIPKRRWRTRMARQLCPTSTAQDTSTSSQLPACTDSQLIMRQVKGKAQLCPHITVLCARKCLQELKDN